MHLQIDASAACQTPSPVQRFAALALAAVGGGIAVWAIVPQASLGGDNHLVVVNDSGRAINDMTVTYGNQHVHLTHVFTTLPAGGAAVLNVDDQWVRPASLEVRFRDEPLTSVQADSVGRYGHTLIVRIDADRKLSFAWDAWPDRHR